MTHSRVQILAADLAACEIRGYGTAPFPSKLDLLIGELVEAYITSSPEERRWILATLDRRHSPALLAFSERMASIAVRQHEPDRLLHGLVALVLEQFRQDPREALTRLPLLYHGADRMGVDHDALFRRAAELAEGDLAEAIRHFPDRSPEDRDIAAMGYHVVEDQDGVRYDRTW